MPEPDEYSSEAKCCRTCRIGTSRGSPHVWLPYCQMKVAPPPLPVVRTEGCRIILADGRELIDGIASWWSVCHGYNHPHIRRAVERELATMPHVMFGGLSHEPAFVLAERLTAIVPPGLTRVFFTDSGSIAVEVAASRSPCNTGSSIRPAREVPFPLLRRRLSRRHPGSDVRLRPRAVDAQGVPQCAGASACRRGSDRRGRSREA